MGRAGRLVGVRARMGNAFGSLSVGNFRLFTLGQIIKLVGVWMQFVAQDWLVLELSHNSPAALGLTTALQFVPVLLLSLYAGKLADRYDKRRLLIFAHAGYSVLALAMGLLVSTGSINLYLVFLFAAGIGTVQAVETPVRQAFVSELVPSALLPNALGLTSATFNLARIAGPAVAGVAIAAVGLSPVFLLNTVTYLAPLVFLLRMDRGALIQVAPTAQPDDARIRDGLVYIRQREDLILPLALVFIVGMIGFNFQVTLSVLAKTVFHSGAASFGLFSSALAAGALLGALVSGTRRARPSPYLVIGAAIGFGTLETVTGFAPSFVTTALLLFPTGFCMILFAQAANQRVQLGTDPHVRGRVMSVWVLVFMGTTPIGASVIGLVGQHFGPRAAIWGAGVVSLAASLGALAWQLHRSGERVHVRFDPLPRFSVS